MPVAIASSSTLSVKRTIDGGGAAGDARATQLERERDAAWVTLSLEGDQEGFRHLVEHYQGRAYRLALGVMGNRDEAWDVAQEAFLRVFRSLHRFQRGQSFYTWLYRIVVNLSIDALRKRAQDRQVALEDLGDSIGIDCPPGTDLAQQELRGLVQAVLDRLPSKYRVVLVLREIEELGCWEISRVVGCTHATARWRLHKARKMFREMWERRLRRSRTAGTEIEPPLSGGRSKPPAFES